MLPSICEICKFWFFWSSTILTKASLGAPRRLAAKIMCKVWKCNLIDWCYNKTIKYDLPLFFVSVCTNVGYCVVAKFVVQDENAQKLLDAVNVLRGWNPEWNPPFFLCDYSEADISASEQAFPGIIIYIYLWFSSRASLGKVDKSPKNGLTKEGEKLLQLLRDCAWAEGGDDVIIHSAQVSTRKTSLSCKALFDSQNQE